MKNSLKSAEAKQIRLSINNQKCEIALNKGYKYDKNTGEIIGVRGKVINAKINGYTVISFVDAGVKQFLYATTFIEYFLKKENATISNDEIEIAKVFVKPSSAFLANRRLILTKRKTLKKAKGVSNNIIFPETLLLQLKRNPFSNDYLTKHEAFNYGNKGLCTGGYRFEVNYQTPVL